MQTDVTKETSDSLIVNMDSVLSCLILLLLLGGITDTLEIACMEPGTTGTTNNVVEQRPNLIMSVDSTDVKIDEEEGRGNRDNIIEAASH